MQEKSKYFVNGQRENLNKVKNMFKGVSLNVDNPHFYVGQSRISKIIGFKPQEVIAMLEETAGKLSPPPHLLGWRSNLASRDSMFLTAPLANAY